jgi:hypothetical protein
MFRNYTEKGILNYAKKQRNKVNNMEKIAEENFENNLDYILLEKLIQSKNISEYILLLFLGNTL